MTDPALNPIVLVGATGALGRLVAEALASRGAKAVALLRRGTEPAKADALRKLGVAVHEVDFDSAAELTHALTGAACVVSTLNGLAPVILDTQGKLLDAAVAAGVPRFIPSDFSLDFTKTRPGSNRNLDLRRQFHARLETSDIAWTSILNGGFMDMLAGEMPLVADRVHRVFYAGDVDQKLDFTMMADVAAFTAAAALDPSTPKILRIAGDSVSTRELAAAASAARGAAYRPLRVGGLGTLGALIRVTRALTGGEDKIFPPWQGMQYMADMFGGGGRLEPLDNDHYPGFRWTKVEQMLGMARAA